MRDPAKNAVCSCPTLHVSIHVTFSSTYYKHSAIQLLCLKEVWSATNTSNCHHETVNNHQELVSCSLSHKLSHNMVLALVPDPNQLPCQKHLIPRL